MSNGTWLPVEDFRTLTDNFFDDLIDHIDFPLENIETTNDEGDWDVGFQDLVPPSLDVFTSLSSEFTCRSACKGQGAEVKKHVPILKQSSSSAASDVKISKQFQSSSPVSVLNNITNTSVLSQNKPQRLPLPLKGIRSKRKRPTTPRIQFLKSFGSVQTTYESESETYLPSEKKKHTKNKNRRVSVSYNQEPFNLDKTTIRKCTHCESTKTPQWREGPNGPKTLCNACGVRFRSGRLVPEYRPVSSPTFIPTVHSNSHRKIVEMRKKGEENQFVNGRIYAVSS